MELTCIIKRPKDESRFTTIKANDKDCLSYAVAFRVPNQKAYGLFHPEFLDGDGKLNKVGRQLASQFFAYAKHREYMDAYREDLIEALETANKTIVQAAPDVANNRADAAVKRLIGYIIASIENNDSLDPEVLKDFVALVKQTGIMKEDEHIIEPPRRYLPITCMQCRYRLFVEEAEKSGDIVDECKKCKALTYAVEHRYRYDPTKNIENEEQEY